MRFFQQRISWLTLAITAFSLLFPVNGNNSDVIDGRGGEDGQNRTNQDKDYGYKFDPTGKSNEKDKISVSLAQSRVEEDYGGCNPPTISNGSVYRDGSDRTGSRSSIAYVCNDEYTNVGSGLLQCDGAHWQPSPDTVCQRTCPELKYNDRGGPGQPTVHLEPVDTPGLFNVFGPYLESTRWRFRCSSGLVPKYDNQYLLECGSDGQWKLLNSQVSPVAGTVQDGSDLCEILNEPCHRLPSKPGITIRYKTMHIGASALMTDDEAIVSCKLSGNVLQSSKREPTKVYRCMSNGRWTDEDELASLSCVSLGCPLPISSPQLKPVYEEQETRSHRQIFADDSGSLIRHGIRIFYRCDDADRYYLVGDTEYVCNSFGIWWPPYWPKCEKRKKCSAVDFPNDGYYEKNPTSDGFEPGHTLTFGCMDGFRLEGRSDLKCLDNGEWNFHPPTCLKDEWTTKRFIAVTSVACLLGVLLVILLGFFLQRQLLLRKALGSARRHRLLDSGGSESRLRFASLNSGVGGRVHHQHPQLLASAARTGPAAFDSDPDRLALIAFADGVQVPLPTYEEAVSQAINERRCHPPPFDAISTLSGYCSRAVRRLPSLSSLRSTRDGSVGNGAPNSPRVHAGAAGNNHPRSRLREQWSSTSGSNVSSQSHGQHNRNVGSNETVAVSDVSTNITLETVSTGGQSQSASARAYAGSLSSLLSSSAGGQTTSIPVVALSVCSASSMASSIGSGSTSTSAGVTSAIGGSQSENLPLLESQELDGNLEDFEGFSSEQQQQAVDNSDEIRSQKSLET